MRQQLRKKGPPAPCRKAVIFHRHVEIKYAKFDEIFTVKLLELAILLDS